MIALYKFEDTYGMYSVFKQSHRVVVDVPVGLFCKIYDNLYVMHGCTSMSIFQMSKREAWIYKKYGIDKLVFVFDADDVNGNKSDILHANNLIDSVNALLRTIESVDWGVDVSFCLMSYSAETILLYQTVKNLSIPVENLVNPVNTDKFQLRLLGIQYGIFNDKKIKNSLESYLDITKLMGTLSSLNKDVFDWIKTGCSTSFKHMNLQEVLQKLADTRHAFNINKTITHRFLVSSEINSKSLETDSQVNPSDLLDTAMHELR